MLDRNRSGLRTRDGTGQMDMGLYREHIFPWLVDHLATGPQLEQLRDRVAGRAVGHVLEIGSGTGANFLSYDTTITSLTTIEPNPGMNRRARQRIRFLEFPVDSRELGCEALPMKDASFDTAVSTLTLCTLPDVGRCLREIHRVLKPGGRFLFLEHGCSDMESVRRWQTRLTGVQRRLCDGCHLDRNIDVLVRDAGFTLESLDNYYLEKVPRVFGFMYEGVATR